mgnify:CR=1 FL=1
MSRLIDAEKIDFNEVFGGQSDFAKDTRVAAQSLIDAQPTVEAVPKSYAEQIRWERDVAVGQLNEIGCQFGQKMEEVKKKLEVLQWIPCSKRLPEEPKGNPIFGYKRVELYLISVKNADYPFRAFWNGKIFTDGFGKVDAIAWMPLPEAYKGEQHEIN